MPIAADERMQPELLTALADFAACDLSVDSLRETIRKLTGTRPTDRWLDLHKLCAEPRIRVTRDHVDRALEMRRTNVITENGLIAWATTLLTNSAFYWDGEDAKTVSEWINGISLDLIPWSS
jgi:hypothetical protein